MPPDVQVWEGPGPPSETFFLDGAFQAFQAEAQGKRLITFAAAEGSSRAVLTLAGRDGVWTSPVTGAFGGVGVGPTADSKAIGAVTKAATAWLRREAPGEAATVRLAPDGYEQRGSDALEHALRRAGWRLDLEDINQHLDVCDEGAFEDGLSETKRKVLRRLERTGASVAELGVETAATVYEVIAENRRSMGYPMTMTWSQVRALAEAFPDRVQFFAVTRSEALLAGAICLRVSGRILYVFYWGERPAFRRESPVVLLAASLVKHAVAEGVTLLDIGVSSVQSTPNPGLLAFKESLGCIASSRRTYVLDPA